MNLTKKISQNNVNKIALFGGSFDPITHGHLCVINLVLKHKLADEIWLLPCYQHMFGKHLTSDVHRINMLNMAIKDYKNVFVIDYEIEKKLSGSTYELLLNLRNEPGMDIYEFFTIIGLDNAQCFKKWHNYEKLINMTNFIVVHRPGIIKDSKINWYLKPPHILIDDQKLMDCSSTIVRKIFKNTSDQHFAKNLLNNDVYNYIINNKLYQ